MKDKELLIAVSGGIDSVVLTHLLYQSNLNLKLAHCNFKLRGNDADIDEQFVKTLAEELNIKAFTRSFDTKAYALKQKLSIQMAARELRYSWFEELLQESELDYVITAHHLDDNLETFLINFTRGTGLSGLTGIPELNGRVIRPLLPFSRREIENYATYNNITWSEDHSNLDSKYTRNKIRNEIIPLLKELNPSLLKSFEQTSEHLQQSQSIINDVVSKIIPEAFTLEEKGIYKIEIQKIQQLSNPKAYLFEILKQYGFTEWRDVMNLLNAQPGKQVFSHTHRLIKDRDHFLLQELHNEEVPNNFLIESEDEQFVTKEFSLQMEKKKVLSKQSLNELIEKGSKKTNIIFVDAEKLQFPLELKKWEEGDYFYPIGMSGKKKLSKFFKDEKYSLIDKENAWLLCSNNQIVWVIGKRLDDRFKITENTKKIVQIEYRA